MFILTEPTPNPETVKFLPGCIIMQNGTLSLKRGDATAQTPLAAHLFRVPGVVSLFFSSDFISVTKGGETDWADLKPLVLATLMEFYSGDTPAVLSSDISELPAQESDVVARIKELLETRVRPAVAADGGDIVFDRFDRGIVYLQMRGACEGCPRSNVTLKHGIENMLRHYIPDVLEVRAA